MKIAELIRLEESNAGTVGVLKIDKQVFCMTLEPSDLLNKRRKSSIPAQQYVCKRHTSSRFGKTFIVTDVPDRFNILFHPLNRSIETEGCIGVGQYAGELEGKRAILNSGKTFKRFMDEMEGENMFHLTILEVY